VEIVQEYRDVTGGDSGREDQSSVAVNTTLESFKSESENTASSQDHTSNTPVQSTIITVANC